MDPNYKLPTGIRFLKENSRFVVSIDRTDKENITSQLELLKTELASMIANLVPNRQINIRIINQVDAVNCFGDFVVILGESS